MIRSAHVVKSPKFELFRGLIAPKLYVPNQNSRTKGTSLGYRLYSLRNDNNRPQLCRLSGSSHKHPTLEYRILGCFGTWKTPWSKLEHFSPVYACEKRFTSVVLKRSKSVQDKWPKGRVALITKYNTFWHRGTELQGRFPPFFLYECAP